MMASVIFAAAWPCCLFAGMIAWMIRPWKEIIEAELMEISAIADDTIKFERIVAWCVAHPDEVPFALHQLMRRSQES